MAAGPGAGDKVIHSYVTPCKISGVQEMLKKESHCHRSTLKLLPLFFSKEELSNSKHRGVHKHINKQATERAE